MKSRDNGKTAPTVLKAEMERLRQKAIELVQKKPEKAAMILTDWIHGRAQNKKKAG